MMSKTFLVTNLTELESRPFRYSLCFLPRIYEMGAFH